MKRRKIDGNKFLAAASISLLIFLAGILLGSMISAEKVSDINDLAQQLQLNTLGAELQFRLISEQPCQFINSSELAEELYAIGSRLDFMESELGQDDPQVLGLKEYYHLLEIRHWLFLKQSKEKCGDKTDLILYFYSNKGDCPKCEAQGNVLTFMRKKYSDISVYSFDSNIDNPALNTIKAQYGLDDTNLPILVINGEVYYDFSDRERIEKAIFTS